MDANRLPTKLLLFEVHEHGDEADIRGDALTPLEDE